jgi:succinate dehydrogenase / fumarate reductase, flavoprotein subunit
MQGLADGYFVIPYTLGDYLASTELPKISTDHDAFGQAADGVTAMTKKLLGIKGDKTVLQFHRELGKIMWDNVGMARTKQSLERAMKEIQHLREEFWQNLKLVGSDEDLNKDLEYAGRLADYFELGELMAKDALHRNESCGGHFREEYQTEEGEALRDDKKFSYVAAWEYTGEGKQPKLHKEPLKFEAIKLAQRSYK